MCSVWFLSTSTAISDPQHRAENTHHHRFPPTRRAYNKLDSSLLGLRSRSMVQTVLLKCNTWIPVEWILYRSSFPTICLYSMKWQWPCPSLDWFALCFGQDRQYLNKLWEIVLDSCGPQRANPADFSPYATRRSTLVVLCEISLQLLDKTACPQLQNGIFFVCCNNFGDSRKQNCSLSKPWSYFQSLLGFTKYKKIQALFKKKPELVCAFVLNLSTQSSFSP